MLLLADLRRAIAGLMEGLLRSSLWRLAWRAYFSILDARSLTHSLASHSQWMRVTGTWGARSAAWICAAALGQGWQQIDSRPRVNARMQNKWLFGRWNAIKNSSRLMQHTMDFLSFAIFNANAFGTQKRGHSSRRSQRQFHWDIYLLTFQFIGRAQVQCCYLLETWNISFSETSASLMHYSIWMNTYNIKLKKLFFCSNQSNSFVFTINYYLYL